MKKIIVLLTFIFLLQSCEVIKSWQIGNPDNVIEESIEVSSAEVRGQPWQGKY